MVEAHVETTAESDRARASSSPSSSARREFGSIEGLRAIAAFFVLVLHTSFNTTANLGTGGFLFARMDSGVSIFFVISGFLLYRPFVAALLVGSERPRVGPYLFRRVLRIYPAYVVAALIIAYGFDYGTYASATDALKHLALVHIYDADTVVSGPIMQAWSLGTEVSFYVALPLLAWVAALVARRTGRALWPQVAFIAALIVTGTVYRYWIEETTGDLSGVYLTWLPGYIDQFAAGMGLALASAWFTYRGQTPHWMESRWFAPAAWMLAVGVFLSTPLIGMAPDNLFYSTGQQMARQASYALLGTLLVAPAVLGRSGSLGHRFLESGVMRYLGLVSYGIYLWHTFFIDRYQRLSDTGVFEGEFERVLAFTVVMSVLVASVSYAVVERPALRLKRLWPAR